LFYIVAILILLIIANQMRFDIFNGLF